MIMSDLKYLSIAGQKKRGVDRDMVSMTALAVDFQSYLSHVERKQMEKLKSKHSEQVSHLMGRHHTLCATCRRQ